MDDDSLIFDFQVKLSILTKLEKHNSLINDTRLSSNEVSVEKTHKNLQTMQDEEDETIKLRPPKTNINDYLQMLEIQRRQGVVNKVQERIQKITDFSKQQETNKKSQWLKKQQEFINGIQQQENDIFESLKEYDKKSLNKHAQLAAYYENLELARQQKENEIKRKEKEKEMLYARIDKVKKIQLSFRTVYEHILGHLKSCIKIQDLKTILSSEFNMLNTILQHFEGVLNKFKTNGSLQEADVAKASELLAQLSKLEKIIHQKVEDINNKEKQSKAPPAPVQNINNTAPVQGINPSASGQSLNPTAPNQSINPTATFQSISVNRSIPNQSINPVTTISQTATKHVENTNLDKYVSKTNLKLYVEIMEFLESFLKQLQNLESDKSQKKFILDCKKAINIPVNSLSGVNAEHILDKYNKFFRLLKGEDVIITERRINASAHPLGISFCLNLLAKQFMLQSDLIISSNPESAFCYATVIMSLWNEFPIFGRLILAYFFKTCPYLVPYNIPRQVGETDEEYYRRQGYIYIEGQIEAQDKFLKRMTGVMRLYAALMIVKPKRGHVNLYGIQNSWKWLVSTLKLEPEIDITATLLHTFLETLGFELDRCYKRVFQKIIRIIAEKYLPLCKGKCTGGAATRLELLITDYYKNRKFETPEGYLNYNYW